MDEPTEISKNLVFIVGDSKTRYGTHEDVPEIKNTFEKHYNAEVHIWMDRTKKDYIKLFSDLKTNSQWIEKFRMCKFVAVFCLFHGDSDGQIGVNNKIINLKTFFLNPFFYIKELDEKLKWLVVQACRGNMGLPDQQTDGEKEKKLYMNYYMISYCTTEGLTSYQWGEDGKIFIQYLCNELFKNANNNYKNPLESIMTVVNDKVQEYGLKKNVLNFPKPEFVHNFNEQFNTSLGQ